MRATLKRRLFSMAGVAAVLAALAALNLLARLAYARFDFSAGRAYSLSTGTRALLSGLSDTLLIKVYFSARLPPPFSLNERYLKDLVKEYRAWAPSRVTLEFLDPDGDEAVRAQAREAGVAPMQINLMGRDRFESKEAWMGVVMLYKGKTQTLPLVERAQDLEFELTRRLKRLAAPRPKIVGFSSGHGEKSPDHPNLKPFFALVKEDIETRSIDLDQPLPDDLDALWLAGPLSPLTTAQVEALKAWAKKGKTLVVLANRRIVDLARFQAEPVDAHLEPLLAAWGLAIGDGLVVDRQSERVQMNMRLGQTTSVRVIDYPFIPLVTDLKAGHPATAGLQAVPFPFVQPIRFDPNQAPATTYESLADSSALSWLALTFDISPDQPRQPLTAGERGPFSLAGVAQGPAGRLLLVATSYHWDPRSATQSAGISFMLNLLDWSAQDETLLALRGKGASFRPLRPIGDASRTAIKYALLAFLPLATLTAAALNWRRRQRRRQALPALYADV